MICKSRPFRMFAASVLTIAAITLVGGIFSIVNEATTLTYPKPVFSDGEIIQASDFNGNYDAIKNVVNGNLDDVNLANDGITASDKIIDGTIDAAAMGTDSVVSGSVVDGTLVTADMADDSTSYPTYNTSALGGTFTPATQVILTSTAIPLVEANADVCCWASVTVDHTSAVLYGLAMEGDTGTGAYSVSRAWTADGAANERVAISGHLCWAHSGAGDAVGRFSLSHNGAGNANYSGESLACAEFRK